jgi:hypothetical protein
LFLQMRWADGANLDAEGLLSTHSGRLILCLLLTRAIVPAQRCARGPAKSALT